MTSSNRRLARAATLAVAATFAVLTLAACGGGGGGPKSMMPSSDGSGTANTPAGGISEAAVTRPIAGSVTQSSDDSQGVTANTVEASVSADSRGLPAADVRGNGWRTQDGNLAFRDHDILPGFRHFVEYRQSQSSGAVRFVSVVSDRNLPAVQDIRATDRWASSSNIAYDSPDGAFDVDTRLYRGILGSLNGVRGTLYCIASCDFEVPSTAPGEQVTFDAIINASIASESDTFDGRYRHSFKFVPQASAQNLPEDMDYLVLGFWENVPAKYIDEFGQRLAPGDQGFTSQFYKDSERGVFVNGNDPFDQRAIQSTTGTATYNGSAFAHYLDTNVDPSTNEGGESYLTGTVTLTADFGGGTQNGTVSGRVDISSSLTGTSAAVTLGSAPIGDSHSGFFTGDTAMTFDGSSFSGKWGGQFYGNGQADGKPGSAAGTFGAATSDGSKAILGAFGAHKQ